MKAFRTHYSKNVGRDGLAQLLIPVIVILGLGMVAFAVLVGVFVWAVLSTVRFLMPLFRRSGSSRKDLDSAQRPRPLAWTLIRRFLSPATKYSAESHAPKAEPTSQSEHSKTVVLEQDERGVWHH